MSDSKDKSKGDGDLKELLKQMAAMMANQQKSLDFLLTKQAKEEEAGGRGVANPAAGDVCRTNTAELLATISQRIKQKFDVDGDGVYAFSTWYGRYRDLFLVDGAELDDKAKVRLLLEQMSDMVHEGYKRQVLPLDPYAISFADTLAKMKELYDTVVSSFTLRYQCFKVERHAGETLLEYTDRVNEACEKADMGKLEGDELNCLLWIFGLKGSSEVAIRQRS